MNKKESTCGILALLFYLTSSLLYIVGLNKQTFFPNDPNDPIEFDASATFGGNLKFLTIIDMVT